MPTAQRTDAITLKFFSGTILVLYIFCYEGFINQNNIDGMVHNHLSSCNA